MTVVVLNFLLDTLPAHDPLFNDTKENDSLGCVSDELVYLRLKDLRAVMFRHPLHVVPGSFAIRLKFREVGS